MVSVFTRITNIGRSSLRMEFKVINDSTDALMAEGCCSSGELGSGRQSAVPFADELKAKVRALEGRALDG